MIKMLTNEYCETTRTQDLSQAAKPGINSPTAMYDARVICSGAYNPEYQKQSLQVACAN